MDVSLINPFLKSTTNLFETMFGLEATAGKPYVLDNLLGHRWQISGVIAVIGGAKGVVAVRLHHILLDKLLEKSGVTVADEDERVETINAMVGEMINIIGGNAISDMAYPGIDISVPMTVQGENHRLSWPKIAPVIGIPFVSKWGNFEVQVCFQG